MSLLGRGTGGQLPIERGELEEGTALRQRVWPRYFIEGIASNGMATLITIPKKYWTRAVRSALRSSEVD